MRTYPTDSAQAAARLLALTLIVDGSATPAEISAARCSRILEHVRLDQQQFDEVLHGLCDDLLTTTSHGLVQIETELIDRLLMEIARADLRRTLWQAMWQVVDADSWLADVEALLLSRAAIMWGAESCFTGDGGSARAGPMGPHRR